MTHRPELLDAIRRCVEAGMSTREIAKELGLVSRSVVIGLAHRNGIKFARKGGGVRGQKRKPKLATAVRKPVTASALATHVVIVKPPAAWKIKPPLRCSWAGCACDVKPGGMFCHEHARRPLFSA